MTALLSIEGLRKEYPVRRGLLRRKVGTVKAVDGISLEIKRGSSFGLLGESGCGKSTLCYMILGLETPTAGSILFRGKDITGLGYRERKAWRKDIQPVFQDPYGALPPRMRVGRILEEPFRIHGLDATGKVAALLERVNLRPGLVDRYPHELSGGQRQRVVIARALALDPSLVVLDEPVSALDVSVQARILDLLESLQADLELTYLFVSHDLGVVRHVADEIGVMYLGDIVERGSADAVYGNALHPYTWTLLWAVPSLREPHLRRRGEQVRGEQPSPLNVPSGCKFRTRCPLATDRCREERPPLREVMPGHWAACHYAEEVPGRMRHLKSETEGAEYELG